MADFDLMVIGAGSGGVRAARVAAELGARVAVAERGPLGGTCVNAGCVPKKLLFYGAERARALQDAGGFGLQVGEARFDWAALVAGKDREVARLNHAYRNTLERAGVTVLSGEARLRARDRVDVGGHEHSTANVLLATGGMPVVPDIPGAELGITSNEALGLPRLPRRVAFVGAGVIALELAGIFGAFGCEVEILYRGREVLSDYDDELRAHVGAELTKQGVRVRHQVDVSRIERHGAELAAVLGDGTAARCDTLIFAIGRRPNTAELGLEALGVQRDAEGAIVVDAYGRSGVPGIYAIGDCIGGIALTPRAIAHGQAVAHTLFGSSARPIEPALLPRAVFGHPEVASVGLSEREARATHADVFCYRSTFKPLVHALSGRDERSFVKLVCKGAAGRVLGCHMAGQNAAEIVQGFAVAMQCGATKTQLDATLGIHPTAAEELVTLRASSG